MQFSEFNLNPVLFNALEKMGFTAPTTVQEKVYPVAVEGQDVMVSSQTGSGKTVAFLLPIFQQLIEQDQLNYPRKERAGNIRFDEPSERGFRNKRRDRHQHDVVAPRALVICPTRELALQVAKEAIFLKGEQRGFRIATVVGGMPYGKQIKELRNATLIVATPGRLMDLYQQKAVNFDEVLYFVADEADRMLDMGFAEDLEFLHKSAPNLQQTLMFSATFPRKVMGLAESMMENPARIELAIEESINEKIAQHLNWSDGREHQRKLLMHWLEQDDLDQAVVFTSTQRESEEIAEELRESGVSASFLHGGLQQNVRNRRLDALRRGRTKILVATDVAARGIDVASITHVINYGLPRKPEDYVHRIGRTGRAGRSGTAITLLHHRDGYLLDAVSRYLDMEIEATQVEGLEPLKKPERGGGAKRGRGRGREGGRNNRRNGGGRSFGGNRSRSDERRGSGEGRRSDERRGSNEERSFGGRSDENRSARFGRREEGSRNEGRGGARRRTSGANRSQGEGRPFGDRPPKRRNRSEGADSGRGRFQR